MNTFEPMTLENCGDGALAEMFASALKSCLADMQDPAKVTTQPRKIQLVIELVPNAENQSLAVVVSADTKLAKRKGVSSFASVDARGNLIQYRNIQEELPLDQVTPIRAANGEKTK